MKPSALFRPEEERSVVEAIRRAEKASSIEVRVHVENRCPGEALDRAVAVFDTLGMRRTAGRNGVLVYVALRDRVSAIIGDENVNRYVHREFWQQTASAMNALFSQGRFAEGIRGAIGRVEEELKPHFPHRPDDANELPDSLSYGVNE